MSLVQDEWAWHGSLHVISSIACKFLQVRSYERGGIRCNVEVDTVHYRSAVLIWRCVNRLADTVHEAQCREFDGRCIFTGRLALRIIVRVEIWQCGSTAGPCAFELVLAYCPDGHRLVRELLQQVVQLSCRNGDSSFLFRCFDLNGGLHGDFLVRGCDLKPVSVQHEQIIFQDGLRRFRRNGLGYGHETFKQFWTGYDKFHISYNFLFRIFALITKVYKISELWHIFWFFTSRLNLNL